ncbi:hypothetical protein SCLCIDRAFT_22486 [Scleroderma citrinum Foug A]|uniref:Uncharacterized protein n=1 Tax=Scleroderma citrinum Foug A TaxID=1036808 RepID=A0A0C2ZVR0_9AGAM|nr:hypothetical protein SCLCIDRAFT_22486 [Scleroderma citrinum Foug A]
MRILLHAGAAIHSCNSNERTIQMQGTLRPYLFEFKRAVQSSKTTLAVGAQTQRLKCQKSTCALEERSSKRPSSILTMPMPSIEETSPSTSMPEFQTPPTPDNPTTQVTPDSTANQPVSSQPICPLQLPTEVDAPRPSRPCRLPRHYQDELPEPMAPVVPMCPVVDLPSLPRRVILHVFDSFRTAFNKFGIARDYRHRPSYDPDALLSVLDLSDLPRCHEVDPNGAHEGCDDSYGSSGERAPPWPWANMSIWRLMTWKLTGSSQKSNGEVTRLVRDMIQAVDFDIDDFANFDASNQLKRLEGKVAPNTTMAFNCDDWREEAPEIIIPTREKQREGNGHSFRVPGLMCRSLTAVIKTAFSEPISKWFHLTPFKHVWKSPSGREQCVYDELYSSDAWNKAHDEIQKQKCTDNCQLERVVAGLMFWSDSMQLNQFGHASAWPIYLFFGNLSKYIRASPASGACYPIVFIPPLLPSLKAFVKTMSQRKSQSDVLAHCKRELFHAVWNILLDKDFIEAYKNGIVVKCFNGKYRHVYPRIFTYSADYPEKTLLATIQDKGHCPCPRCLIPKAHFSNTGLWNDIKAWISQARTYMQSKIISARDAIYQHGAPIKGAIVERLLKDSSLVPTLNAFTEHLSPLGFKLFPIIVVDLMHEFELGVLKNVLKHLIRILYIVDPSNIARLNERYMAIPPFGVDGIRSFPLDIVEMTQKTVHHFEDMLQCAIPAFDSLFLDEHNASIRVLLFRLTVSQSE